MNPIKFAKIAAGVLTLFFLVRIVLFTLEQGATWLLKFFILGEIPGTSIQITFRAVMLATAIGLAMYLARRFDQQQANLQ